jgi:hypothetical protein
VLAAEWGSGGLLALTRRPREKSGRATRPIDSEYSAASIFDGRIWLAARPRFHPAACRAKILST